MATIESQDLTLEKLFNDFYVVPDYQREYIWQEKQVYQLLKDIHDEFSSNGSGSASEYFIGSIVVHVRDKGVYELIDGQQRMTTAYLVLCAVRDYRQDIKPDEPIEALKNLITAMYTDDEGNDKFRDRVELQYEDSRLVLEKIAKREDLGEIDNTISVENIKNAYVLIRKFFEDEFGQDETAIQKVKKFYAYFIKNVKLVRIETSSVTDALRVFSTINERGIGLDSMDLLKNMMFIKANESQFNSLKREWKEMVNILFKAKKKPMRFLRYFIFAQYEVKKDRLREDQIYEWFSENKDRCGYDKNPIAFVDELRKAAKAYVNFIEGKDAEGQINRYLVNINCLSTKQHLMLLLASQHLPKDVFTELCRQIENLLFVYIITREGTNKLELLFAQWTSELRKIKDQEALDKFLTENFQPAKKNLADRFELAFRQMNESSVTKKLMRYILGKLTQYVDERAWGSDGECSDLKNYMNKKIEIEHILPQNPLPDIHSSFDKPNNINTYIKKLGNLTILEKSINGSVGNKPFEEKKKVYPNTKFLLTRSIAEKVTVGCNTTVDRAVRDLKNYDTWDSKSIECRQEMLTQLAKKVWDVPEGKSKVKSQKSKIKATDIC